MGGISVIMPTYNRAHLLPNSINSLMWQQRKPDEIIVIDDGSEDNTYEVVTKLAQTYKCLRYFYRGSPLWINPCVPLNIGIRESCYDLIVISLSDMVHVGETLTYIEKRHKEEKLLYLIGSKIYWVMKDVVIPSSYWNDPSKILDMDNVVVWETGFISQDNQIVCTLDSYSSNIVSCKRKYLFEINGFDEAMTEFYGHEDSDLTQRLYNYGLPEKDAKQSNFKIVRDNSIIGIHQWHERPPAYATCGTESQRQKTRENFNKIKVNLGGWGKLENCKEIFLYKN